MPIYRFGDMLVDPHKYPWGRLKWSPQWALEFDGTNDYVDTGYKPTGSVHTAEVWFKPFIDTDYYVFGVHDIGGSRLYGGTEHGWRIGDSEVANPSFTVGEWYHAALVGDGSSIFLCINGDLVAYAGYSWTEPQEDDMLIGWSSNQLNKFNGLIRDFRLWNVARTQQEIQNNMSKPLMGNETGLVGYWPMNEGEGVTVYDKASSNDGTIHGATWVEI